MPDSKPVTIRIPIWRWRRAILELRRRGRGRGESGAFLLGRESGDSARVTHIVCYDDLDPHAIRTGAITFHAEGYAALWKYCRENKIHVLADVHTHPGGDVRQSSIDQRHPMVPVAGHVATIVPHFGNTAWWSIGAVGVYEHLGKFKWHTWTPAERAARIKLALW